MSEKEKNLQKPDFQQLEPVTSDVNRNSEATQSNAVDNFWDNYPILMSNALIYFMQQDLDNLRQTINTTEYLLEEARKITSDDNEGLIMLFLSRIVYLFEPMTRAVKYQTEGRFKTAQGEFRKASDFCKTQTFELKSIRISPNDEMIKVLYMLVDTFNIFEKWMLAYIKYCDAEISGYQGHTFKYVEQLKETVQILRDAVKSVPPGAASEVLQIAAMCSKIADQWELRSEAFENITTVKKYIEPTGKKVFIIHGHDEGKWRELRDLLEDEFKLKVTVLKEMAGSGLTMINKFEEHATDSFSAFAILTPDDIVKNGSNTLLQARPNALFEMGWFYGRYGAKHLCILLKKGTSLPSDLAGISVIEFNDSIAEKSLQIRKELRQIGLIE